MTCEKTDDLLAIADENTAAVESRIAEAENPAAQEPGLLEVRAEIQAFLDEAVSAGIAAEEQARADRADAAAKEALAPLTSANFDNLPETHKAMPAPAAATRRQPGEAPKPRNKDKRKPHVQGESLREGLSRVRGSLWHTGTPDDQQHSTTLVARSVHDTMLEAAGCDGLLKEYLPSDILVPEVGTTLLTPARLSERVKEKCRKGKVAVAEFYGYVVMHRVGQRFQYRLMAQPEGMEEGRLPSRQSHVKRVMLLGSEQEIQAARAFQVYTRRVRNADGVSTMIFAYPIH